MAVISVDIFFLRFMKKHFKLLVSCLGNSFPTFDFKNSQSKSFSNKNEVKTSIL